MQGVIVYAGVDYARILSLAEAEADIILWDGGNNDFSFLRSDLSIVIVDPHRPGHELHYHPGETNVRSADIILINKVDTAEQAAVDEVRGNIQRLNPDASIIEAASPFTSDQPDQIKGKRVLVIEDGPTLTHGDMAYGAGWLAAKEFQAAEIINPRPFATGSIKAVYENYPSTGDVLPAMGYGDEQIAELEETIHASNAELVIVGTPIDLGRILDIDKPTVRVQYELADLSSPTLRQMIEAKFQPK